jgi:hypothetical protein
MLGCDAHRNAQLEEKKTRELARYPPYYHSTHPQQTQAEDEMDEDEDEVTATHWLADRGTIVYSPRTQAKTA